MNTPLTEQDLIQLNAYLDGELSVAERADVEARLAEDERLQAEIESLRVTAALLGMAERVRVPRNFTLDPAVYGRSARSGWWANLGLGDFRVWATAGGTVLATLVCIGLMVIRIGMGGMMATSAPMAQLAAEEPEAEATNEPTAAEWMAEEVGSAAATEKESVADAQTRGETAVPEATAPPPAPTLVAPSAGGGIGGGPSEDMMTAEAGGSSEIASSPTPAAVEAPTGEQNVTENGADTLAAPSVAGEGREPASSSPPPLPDGTQLHAYTAAVVTPTPTPTWGDAHLFGLPVKSILLLAGGMIILIVAVTLISVTLKRHPQ